MGFQQDQGAIIDDTFEDEIKASLDMCLFCGACTGLCPAHVDIPTARSHFLERYHASFAAAARKASRLGRTGHAHRCQFAFSKHGRPAESSEREIIARDRLERSPYSATGALPFHAVQREHPDPQPKKPGSPPSFSKQRTVLLLPDSYNAAFNPGVLMSTLKLLTKMGFDVACAPILVNGKILEMLG